MEAKSSVAQSVNNLHLLPQACRIVLYSRSKRTWLKLRLCIFEVTTSSLAQQTKHSGSGT